ncbi:MAG: carbon monoxide dehydrogenase [Anaerolineae bacterium]|nr:carbon monoxide dehydrogenase [Anaerolineae bacterium]
MDDRGAAMSGLALGRAAIRQTTSELTWVNRWDHIQARWGVRRSEHRVEPGLYALGDPGPESPVFVTANYTLSFDALRAALSGIDGYILVLDTKGINVWCAAGKGTFGTDELVHRIEVVGLADVVRHRTLILPQLGAPGVSAHEVRRRSGFRVEYGPVRAEDLPAYLETHKATPEMRRVRFALRDRLVLIPVEFVHVLRPMAIAGVLLWLLVGSLAAWGAVAAILAGAVLFPILLPWLPTRAFSSKGFLLGGAVGIAFALLAFYGGRDLALWRRVGWALAYVLALPPITAYLALNFTGSTTYTSKSGVQREMDTYIRPMAWTFALGMAVTLVSSIFQWIGS